MSVCEKEAMRAVSFFLDSNCNANVRGIIRHVGNKMVLKVDRISVIQSSFLIKHCKRVWWSSYAGESTLQKANSTTYKYGITQCSLIHMQALSGNCLALGWTESIELHICKNDLESNVAVIYKFKKILIRSTCETFTPSTITICINN